MAGEFPLSLFTVHLLSKTHINNHFAEKTKLKQNDIVLMLFESIMLL